MEAAPLNVGINVVIKTNQIKTTKYEEYIQTIDNH